MFYTFYCSLRKQPAFRYPATGFPAKRRLRNEQRNSILMTRHYPDLLSASDWLGVCLNSTNLKQRQDLGSDTHSHQYGISALVSQTSFREEPMVASPNVSSFLRQFLPQSSRQTREYRTRPWQKRKKNVRLENNIVFSFVTEHPAIYIYIYHHSTADKMKWP